MNLTLVAFYHSKPDPLLRLIERIQKVLVSALGPAFSAYQAEQVHATIIGLEGWRVGRDVFNANAVSACASASPMDLDGLLRSVQDMPPLNIRIGGFSASDSYPFTSRSLHPHLRSFSLIGQQAVLTGWAVADGTFPMTLDSIRKSCKRYNVVHKYHLQEGDVDNDFFLVLGRLHHHPVSAEIASGLQRTVRQMLAEQEPVEIAVRPEDLSVVAYRDARLPTGSSVMFSISAALDCVDELFLLYQDGSSFGAEEG